MVLTKDGQEPGSSCLDVYIFSLSLLSFSTSLSERVSPLLVRTFFFFFFRKTYMHVCIHNIMYVYICTLFLYRVCYTQKIFICMLYIYAEIVAIDINCNLDKNKICMNTKQRQVRLFFFFFNLFLLTRSSFILR